VRRDVGLAVFGWLGSHDRERYQVRTYDSRNGDPGWIGSWGGICDSLIKMDGGRYRFDISRMDLFCALWVRYDLMDSVIGRNDVMEERCRRL
jgi:hypothetical protein